MKTQTLKLTTLSLFTAAAIFAPALTRAQSTNAPAASTQTAPAAPRKHKTLVFRGTISGIDTNAMTLTAGGRTFEITSETKILKNGEPATLSDGEVGDLVGGTYKKTDDGKMAAVSLHFSAKKKTGSAAAGATNSVSK